MFLIVCEIIVVLFVLNMLVCFLYTYLKKRNLKNVKPSVQQQPVDNSLIPRVKGNIQKLVAGNYLYCIKLIGKIPSQHIRIFFYRYIFEVNLSKKVVIYGGAEIREPYKLFIGKGSVIGNDAILDARNGIYIGESVNISSGVWLWTEQHNYQSPTFDLDDKKKGIVIGDRVWLGPRVIVLPDVVIGEGTVVAAGSVVTGDLEPYGLYAGIPAKRIKERNRVSYNFTGEYLSFI